MRRGRALPVVAVVVALGLGACSGGSGHHDTASTTATTHAPVSPDVDPAYARPGPFVVGLTTLAIGTRQVEVMYPAKKGSEEGEDKATYDLRDSLHTPPSKPVPDDADQRITLPAYRDLPTAPGKFPVVLFSDGYGADPFQTAMLESSITAWGFVVIVPDHTERDSLAVLQGRASVNDHRDANVLLAALNAARSDGSLRPIIDLSRIAAVGNAQGGATAIAALASPAVDVAVAYASVTPPKPLAKKPVMLIGAARDLEYGTRPQTAIYDELRGPRRLVLLGGGAGHSTFVDQCEDLRTSGQLVVGSDVATKNHVLDLAQNGCYPDELDPTLAWPVITHFTVAELRSVFGIDRTPIGLGAGIASAFPDVPLTYTQHS